jgi:hypothetical protein
MSLSDITSEHAVKEAIAEFDRIGRDRFLEKYGFRKATKYYLVRNGRHYDSKAIVGAAHGYQYPKRGKLAACSFSGGKNTVKPLLKKLGFEVRP